jgi:hypothetical protein
MALYPRHVRLTHSALGLALGWALLTSSREALAGPSDAILLPTTTSEGSGASEAKAEPSEEMRKLAREIDAIVSEAAQDLGLTLTVSGRDREVGAVLSEAALVERAHDSWVISPRLELRSEGTTLRIVAVPPGSKVLLERSQRVEADALDVRTNVMLSDVVRWGRGRPEPGPTSSVVAKSERNLDQAPRSQGRAVLALNAGVVGGYVGFSLQRAGGSTDARLTYPLVALGAGMGLGASMLVADEWNIGLGDAWFLAAGAWWPIASGLLVAKSYDVRPQDRYMYGLIAASAGVTLSTAALSMRPMGEGGALLAHSGGVFGLLLGGMVELMDKGSTKVTPERGMGYGAGAGVLVAGALATQVQISATRMLLIDLSASLGALAGAAAASPILLVEDKESQTRNRLFLASATLGALVGGGIGLWSTAGTSNEAHLASVPCIPFANVEPSSAANGTRGSVQFGVQGLW